MFGVDNFAIASDQTFDLSTTAHSLEAIAANEHRAVVNDRELTEISAGPRAFRPRQGHDL
jgi:hypothetical protein